MNKDTKNALEGSIKKWEKIVEGTGSDKSTKNCPLCIKFFDNGCNGCPVEKAGHYECTDTPYMDWCRYQEETHKSESFPYKVFDTKSEALAQKEVDFLKSLLPVEGSTSVEVVEALNIVLGSDVFDAMVKARINIPTMLNMAAVMLFRRPDDFAKCYQDIIRSSLDYMVTNDKYARDI